MSDRTILDAIKHKIVDINKCHFNYDKSKEGDPDFFAPNGVPLYQYIMQYMVETPLPFLSYRGIDPEIKRLAAKRKNYEFLGLMSETFIQTVVPAFFNTNPSETTQWETRRIYQNMEEFVRVHYDTQQFVPTWSLCLHPEVFYHYMRDFPLDWNTGHDFRQNMDIFSVYGVTFRLIIDEQLPDDRVWLFPYEELIIEQTRAEDEEFIEQTEMRQTITFYRQICLGNIRYISEAKVRKSYRIELL